MAFAYHSLRTLGDIGTPDGSAGSRRCLHGYTTNDGQSTIMATNYFLPAWSHFKVGDVIQCAIDLTTAPKALQLVVTAASKTGVTVDLRTAAQMTGQPPNNRIMVIGNSKGAQHHSAVLSQSANGPVHWANIFSGHRADFEYEDNYGYSGDWSSANTWNAVAYPGTLDQLPGILASNDAGIVVSFIFDNDRNAWNADQSIANFDAINTMIRNAGRVHIPVVCGPRGDSVNTGNTLADPQFRYQQKLDRYLLNQAKKGGVYPVNLYDLFADRTSTNGRGLTGYLYDGLHFSTFGAMIIGQKIAEILMSILPPRNKAPFSITEVYDATYNPGGIINTNPFLGGTGGAFGPNTSGQLAAGFLTPTGAGQQFSDNGITGVYSKIAGATSFAGKNYQDNGGPASKDFQQVVLSGTATTANELDILRVNLTTGFSIGQILRAIADIEIDAGVTGIASFYIRVWDSASSPTIRSLAVASGALATTVWPNKALALFHRTPKWKQLSGQFYLNLTAKLISGANVAATVRCAALAAGQNLV